LRKLLGLRQPQALANRVTGSIESLRIAEDDQCDVGPHQERVEL
jgi:hypothetical protein